MNKIGWCDMTWNPVWGCKNHCEYCYARGIAKRFWKQVWTIEANHQWKEHPGWAWTGDHLEGLKDFKPTFLNAQFEKKLPKKPQRIFVGSMSEIHYWDEVWIKRVIEKVKQYPQHTFQLLSKESYAYANYYYPLNCWLGLTITKESDFENISYGFSNNHHHVTFVSIEPILEEINPKLINTLNVDWVIIGAETGNRKDKVIPDLGWVLEIAGYCKHHKIPVYIKDNLTKYYAECRGYKGFPKEVKHD